MKAREPLLGALPGASGEPASLGGTSEWLNSPPLSARDLEGSVVLIQFWTYSCINWLRTLPYVRAWAERYGEQGLVTIGVHAPEFGFEHDVDNVRRAAKDMDIDYPIVIDNDFAIWRAFDNHYWPALYLIDAPGRLRHQHFGEGEYVPSERVIRRLLGEAGTLQTADDLDADDDVVSVAAAGVEMAADWDSLRSPETYVGYERAEHFASLGGVRADERRRYDVPDRLRLNRWALAGDWTVRGEAAESDEAGGRIVCRFQARDVHLVMGARTGDAPVPFRVRIDGASPGAAHGIDADDEGRGTVREPRLYQLIRQRGPVHEREFEIEFLDAGARAYVFTFG